MQRNKLLIHSYRLQHGAPQTAPGESRPVQALVPDPWFAQHTHQLGTRLTGAVVVVDQTHAVTVLEHHVAAVQVASFTKALAFLNEARTSLALVGDNLRSLLAAGSSLMRAPTVSIVAATPQWSSPRLVVRVESSGSVVDAPNVPHADGANNNNNNQLEEDGDGDDDLAVPGAVPEQTRPKLLVQPSPSAQEWFSGHVRVL